MRKDDMHVIICKLLAYLYDCMKKGKQPDRDMFDRDGIIFCGVPDAYRCAIVREVVEHGYIKGLKVVECDNTREVVPVNPSVTLEGVEFMGENKTMRRAWESLRDAGVSLPFIVSAVGLFL